MKPHDLEHATAKYTPDLHYDGDNSEFVILAVLPFLHLSDYDKQVVRWAYGYDGEPRSYELESDGETGVKDYFLGGSIKCPAGVCHDFINRILDHTTADGKVWKRQQSNQLYLRLAKSLGYPPMLRWRRWMFLSSTWFWWQ